MIKYSKLQKRCKAERSVLPLDSMKPVTFVMNLNSLPEVQNAVTATYWLCLTLQTVSVPQSQSTTEKIELLPRFQSLWIFGLRLSFLSTSLLIPEMGPHTGVLCCFLEIFTSFQTLKINAFLQSKTLPKLARNRMVGAKNFWHVWERLKSSNFKGKKISSIRNKTPKSRTEPQKIRTLRYPQIVRCSDHSIVL